MDILPQEIWWTIFSYYSIEELIKLYQRKDSEINNLLDNSHFWYQYQKCTPYNDRIERSIKTFTQWIVEFHRVKTTMDTLDVNIEEFILSFDVYQIKSFKMLSSINNKNMNDVIQNILIYPNIDVSLEFGVFDGVFMMYLYYDEKRFLITNDYDLIGEIIFDLVYNYSLPKRKYYQ